ncbi:hypothetical protein PTN56_10235 [Clostridium perfringens]|nr:hypothetical protein [Clostridium perfringens]
MLINIKKYYSFVVATIIITSQYASFIPGVSIGELLLIMGIVLWLIYFFINHKKIDYIISNCNRNIFIFIYFLVIITLISLFTQYNYNVVDIVTRSIRYSFYIFASFIVSRFLIDFKYFIKVYRFFVILATLYIFFQIIIFYSTGRYISGIVPFLRVTNSFYSYNESVKMFTFFFRPGSLFMEPGYYAIFVLPYLAYCLFFYDKTSYKNIILALYIFSGLFLSTSGQGIIIGSLLFVIFILKNLLNLRNKTINIKIFLIGIILICISIYLIDSNEMLQKSISRLFIGDQASSNSRIFNGFIMYSKLDFLHKIIGVGYGNVGNFLVSNGLSDLSIEMSDYMNSIATISISLGLIGIIIFFILIINLFRKANYFGKICVLILLLLSFIGDNATSITLVLYVSIIINNCLDIEKEIKINENKRFFRSNII